MVHCFPDYRAISQGHPGSYRRAPAVAARRRNVAQASSLCSVRPLSNASLKRPNYTTLPAAYWALPGTHFRTG
jgi:hypothetical protein